MVLHCRVATWLPIAVVATLFLGIAGCGKSGSEYQVAPVTGKVTFNGEPVPEGTVRFQPLSEAAGKAGITGKPATWHCRTGRNLFSLHLRRERRGCHRKAPCALLA